MGYFAVVSDHSADEKPAVVITALHLNLWCLWTYGARRLVCDIGLKFRVPKGKTCDELVLLVPVEPEEITDLTQELRDPDIAQLVFGEPTTINDVEQSQATLRMGRRTLYLKSVRPTSEPYAGRTDLWTCKLPLQEPIIGTGGKEYYVRVRLEVGDFGRLWVWKSRPLGVHTGALIDLRLSDVRDSHHADSDKILEHKILPIPEASLFVIAPWSLRFRTASPTLRYTRVLEGDSWKSYLHRPVNPPSRRRTKSLVHYWRYPVTAQGEVLEKAQEITVQRPFYAFLELGREPGLGWFEYIPPAALGVILYLVVSRWEHLLHPHLGHLVTLLHGAVTVLGIGVLAVAGWLIKARRWWQSLAKGRRAWERKRIKAKAR